MAPWPARSPSCAYPETGPIASSSSAPAWPRQKRHPRRWRSRRHHDPTELTQAAVTPAHVEQIDAGLSAASSHLSLPPTLRRGYACRMKSLLLAVSMAAAALVVQPADTAQAEEESLSIASLMAGESTIEGAWR